MAAVNRIGCDCGVTVTLGVAVGVGVTVTLSVGVTVGVTVGLGVGCNGCGNRLMSIEYVSACV